MNANWQRVISENMAPLEIPGWDIPLYKPREGAWVWIVTTLGEVPCVPPPLERIDMTPCGGKELDLDVSDPDFLRVHKTVGMSEYRHAIPWDKVIDIVFYQAMV
jgi:hypothetical protein